MNIQTGYPGFIEAENYNFDAHRIQITTVDNKKFEIVECEDGGLSIHVDGQLSIKPKAANFLEVNTTRY